MFFVSLADLKELEPVPGFKARFVHGDQLTMAYWTVAAGASMPQHANVHEQIANVIEGEFEMTIGGEKKILKPGQVAVLPSNAPHSGKALTPCYLVDVFHPVREDYPNAAR